MWSDGTTTGSPAEKSHAEYYEIPDAQFTKDMKEQRLAKQKRKALHRPIYYGQ